MTMFLKSIALLLSLSLAACGFKPMYATGANTPAVTTHFDQIEIAPIADRLGQKIHNGLLDQLTPYGAAQTSRYRLVVTLAENLQGFGFREDESITRQNFRLSAHYELVDIETGTALTKGDVSSNMAFDVVQSDFANHSAFEDARSRTAEQVVATLVLRLGSFFQTRPDPS